MKEKKNLESCPSGGKEGCLKSVTEIAYGTNI